MREMVQPDKDSQGEDDAASEEAERQRRIQSVAGKYSDLFGEGYLEEVRSGGTYCGSLVEEPQSSRLTEDEEAFAIFAEIPAAAFDPRSRADAARRFARSALQAELKLLTWLPAYEVADLLHVDSADVEQARLRRELYAVKV